MDAILFNLKLLLRHEESTQPEIDTKDRYIIMAETAKEPTRIPALARNTSMQSQQTANTVQQNVKTDATMNALCNHRTR